MVQINFNVGTLNLNKLWALVSLNASICAENNHLVNLGGDGLLSHLSKHF